MARMGAAVREYLASLPPNGAVVTKLPQYSVVPLESAVHVAGRVVKGFGRGSKELGCPTANLASEDVDSTIERLGRRGRARAVHGLRVKGAQPVVPGRDQASDR